ncbi:MAG: hypothetical protein IT193_04540 [Propionibacteriaceae bacterium]|nr:hypothetical protein [Propionibacteriaceae bacterium]
MSRQFGLRQIGRRPAEHFVLLLQQPDPPPGLAQLAEATWLVPGRSPSSMSAFFIHEYNVVRWIPKSLAV